MAEEIDSAGVKRLILHFKKDEDNTLKLIQPVQKQEVGPTGPANPQPITAQPGDPGGYEIGKLVTYTKNPTCIGFVIGGSYYEICF